MDFSIQASAPRITGGFDATDESLLEAVETIFPLKTEKAFIKWNHHYIPLCYKYDLSVMILEILNMLVSINSKQIGVYVAYWGSDTFDSVWDIKWKDDNIEIISKWNSVLGGLEDMLNIESKLIVSKSKFISEWKKILSVVKEGLISSGYNQENIADFDSLIFVCGFVDPDSE